LNAYREKLLSISIAGSATPTRSGNHQAKVKQAQWDKDDEAYRRLVKAGLQPPTSKGSAYREATMDEAHQIEQRPTDQQLLEMKQVTEAYPELAGPVSRVDEQ